MNEADTYDVVIVGGGVVGAVFAKVLAESARRDRRHISILLLEAGHDTGLSAAGYETYVQRFHASLVKTPNSPYPASPNAPTADVRDLFMRPPRDRYLVNTGSIGFGSDYTRALGGTTLHWMGITLRMLPADFQMRRRYGVGVDWPFDHKTLEPYYQMAEWELGVSGNAMDQQHVPGADTTQWAAYEYPMEGVPTSYLDRMLADRLGENATVRVGEEDLPLRFVPLPQARNTTPRTDVQDPRTYLAARREYQPFGAPDDPITGPGQRCEGNASCIPICPARAKYSALKTIQQLRDLNRTPGVSVTVQTMSVVTKLEADAVGRITRAEYLRYGQDGLPHAVATRVSGRRFVLAANAIENAKILLASRSSEMPNGLANDSDAVGRHLMDHPFVLAWGRMRDGTALGTFRGPGATVDLPVRDGKFRSQHAAFRTDVSNWGWGLIDDAPYRDVDRLIDPDAHRARYAGRPAAALLGTAPVYGAQLRMQLQASVQSQVQFGFLLEQMPDPRNRITIDDAVRDVVGVHRPVIAYELDSYTRAGMVEARRFAQHLFGKLGIYNFTDDEFGIGEQVVHNGQVVRFIGAGHVMGAHCMGRSHCDSVVDEFQRTWRHPNLFVVGCGSMPTAGTSNPTLTAVALTIRSAEHLYDNLELPCR